MIATDPRTAPRQDRDSDVVELAPSLKTGDAILTPQWQIVLLCGRDAPFSTGHLAGNGATRKLFAPAALDTIGGIGIMSTDLI